MKPHIDPTHTPTAVKMSPQAQSSALSLCSGHSSCASHHPPASPLLDHGFTPCSSKHILHFGSVFHIKHTKHPLSLHTFSCATPEKRLKFKHKARAGALSHAGHKCLQEAAEKPPWPSTVPGQTQSKRCINTRSPLHGTQGFLSRLKHTLTPKHLTKAKISHSTSHSQPPHQH